MWSLATKRFMGANGKVSGLEVVEVEWKNDGGRMKMAERPGTEKKLDADLVLLSMGFVHPVHEGLISELGLEHDDRGNVKVDEGNRTSVDKVFAAGDAATGASLVVRAIASGRSAAASIDGFLKD